MNGGGGVIVKVVVKDMDSFMFYKGRMRKFLGGMRTIHSHQT